MLFFEVYLIAIFPFYFDFLDLFKEENAYNTTKMFDSNPKLKSNISFNKTGIILSHGRLIFLITNFSVIDFLA